MKRWSTAASLTLISCLALACSDDASTTSSSGTETGDGDGDGDGDTTGDEDSTTNMSGDGDGDPAGDGDGDPTGDGDGDPTGDGDGDPTGDGDGDPTGDGDGDTAGDGDGDPIGVCGDGAVDEGEDCDDGNDDETDACTSLCAAPACDDGIVSGDESDLDCGGSCGGCEPGFACVDALDCEGGICGDGVCGFASSCAVLNAAAPNQANGLYMLDPDGEGPDAAYEAYCDMSTDGGGWTLVMKALEDNFPYEDPMWEDETLLNENDYDFAAPGTKSKYQAYTSVRFQTLRTSDPDDFGTNYQHDLGQSVDSARELFTGVGIEISTELEDYFNDRVPDTAKQFGCTNHISVGINQEDYLGLDFINGGGQCDWNGGARFGQRVNANHGGTGNHAGQGWGAYTTVGGDWYLLTNQLLWVK